jgi:cell shape-determining protein MreC
MKKSKFRTPLLQSAAVLGGVIVLALIAASSGSGSAGGGFLAILAGIGNSILFIIGLVIGVLISIALLIGVFLAAVGMTSPEQASQMYTDLKKNVSLNLLACKTWCSYDNTSGNWISNDDYNRMKQEISELQEQNAILSRKVDELQADNDQLKTRASLK